jgi:hypothetical protein
MSQPVKRNSVAKAGVNLLKKIVLENYQESERELRASGRQSVVGEVKVTILDASGQPMGETLAFVRNTSRTGCGLWSRVAIPTGRTVMIEGQSRTGKGTAQRMASVRHCRGAAGTGFAIGVRFAANSGETSEAA